MKNIKLYRKSLGLTQRELADACGWGDSAQYRVCSYENGRRTPSVDDVKKIVSAFNDCGLIISVDDLINDKKEGDMPSAIKKVG